MPRCKKCTYVFDQDEWICETCGFAADRTLAGILSRSLSRLVSRQADADDDFPELEDADYDADELGLDPEED